jgi:hypothetical protein
MTRVDTRQDGKPEQISGNRSTWLGRTILDAKLARSQSPIARANARVNLRIDLQDAKTFVSSAFRRLAGRA